MKKQQGVGFIEATITKQRLHTLDLVRGAMLVVVMGYHLCFDLAVFFGVSMPWFFGWQGETIRVACVTTLMTISGMSCSLSRNNARRGAKTLALAMLLTVATLFALPDAPILFGVLHYFGTMMLIFAACEGFVKRLPTWSILVFIALFLVLYQLPSGQLLGVEMPRWLYQSKLTFWIGLPHFGFSSVDYYPLLPWSMLFFGGAVAGNHFKSNGFPEVFSRFQSRPLEFIGRNSIWFYLVHQVVFLPILYVVFLFVK